MWFFFSWGTPMWAMLTALSRGITPIRCARAGAFRPRAKDERRRKGREPSLRLLVLGENSIRLAYRTSGVIAPAFYSLAYVGDVPCAGVT